MPFYNRGRKYFGSADGIGSMKKSINGGRKKMEKQKNKPIERIKEGRISLLKWQNPIEMENLSPASP